MGIFGLLTRKEVQAHVENAVKSALGDLPGWLMRTAEAERFNIPDPSIYGNQADLYRKLSWVLQAVDITASSAALSQFDVKRIVQGKEPKDIPNHPFELLLQQPNPLDSRYEFLYGTVAMWKLTGNAYWWLNRASEDAPPDELWLIPSHMITPVPDANMFIQGYYYYPGTGAELLLPPHEVLHFRRFNMASRFVGLSAIESLANVAAGDLAMQGWNTRLFAENNARLPGILTFEQMVADATWQRIKDDTREAAKKRELLMLRGVGQGGVNWLQNAVSQKEMEFLQGREFNRNEIWNTLAPGLVSMLSESATEANSRTGAAVFNERTVYPMHVMMGEKITNHLLPSYGGRQLLGMFEDIRITDKELELREQERYAATHTIEEIREEFYGDEPLGDERDKLLPSQVNAQSGGIQEPPVPVGGVPGQPAPKDGVDKEVDAAENKPPKDKPEPEPKEDEAKKAMVEELRRYERKALKNVGKPVPFVSDFLPADILSSIERNLPACKSETAVKAVFDAERGKLRQAKPDKRGALAVIDALRATLQADA